MKTRTILTACLIISILSFGQTSQQSEVDVKTITNFEKYIIVGNKPDNAIAQTKYENDYRVIVWDEPLIKSYKYSNQAFDKLGYELVNENEGDYQQHSIVYRNCQKGIIVTVTEWYRMKYSISMEWFDPSVRRSIGYLMYCKTNIIESEAEIKKREQEEKNKKERELRNKDLKASFDPIVLNVLYDYFMEFKNVHPDFYNFSLDNYYKNTRNSQNTDSDYSMFYLIFVFDTTGVPNNAYVYNAFRMMKSEAEKINFNTDWFSKIKPLVRIDKPSPFVIDFYKQFGYNISISCFYSFQEISKEKQIEFFKNKKGELIIPTIDTKGNIVPRDKYLQLLNKNENVKLLKKGNYTATLKTSTIKMKFSHFNNHGKKEDLIGEIEKEEIGLIKFLK